MAQAANMKSKSATICFQSPSCFVHLKIPQNTKTVARKMAAHTNPKTRRDPPSPATHPEKSEPTICRPFRFDEACVLWS